jgi:hypothetical protein
MEAVMESVFSRLFRVCGFEKADDGVVETYNDLVLFGTNGYAGTPG